MRLHFCDATGSADSHHQDGYPYIEGIWRPKCEGGLGNRDGGSHSTMFEERRGCYADWDAVREVLAANAQLLVLARQQRKKKRKRD